MSHACHVPYIPFEHALDGSSGDVVHEYEDCCILHARAQIAHNVLVSQTLQDGHLSLDLAVLLCGHHNIIGITSHVQDMTTS